MHRNTADCGSLPKDTAYAAADQRICSAFGGCLSALQPSRLSLNVHRPLAAQQRCRETAEAIAHGPQALSARPGDQAQHVDDIAFFLRAALGLDRRDQLMQARVE